MRHIDLFSGIGGFALAVDTVWPNSQHVFVENDPYCQQVLKKHWPQAQIYGDIRTFTNTRLEHGESRDKQRVEADETIGTTRSIDAERQSEISILTGGFPCQPFSQAGRRQGTADDRYLWPEMFRVIREFKPTWVIAENVRGLLTINEGLVFEQVCADLESEGYEVQPIIIPAVSVNAPHRRDRVWFIADNRSAGLEETGAEQQTARSGGNSEWESNWLEVATELCGVDDGLSAELDGLKLSKAGHRNARLKALGNAIVPQVAIEIMKAIKQTNELRQS